RSQGESRGDSLHSGTSDGQAFMSPASPANPFTDYVYAYFPIADLDDPTRKRDERTRYTAGLLAELPFEWGGPAEMSWGKFRHDSSASGEYLTLGTLALFGDPSDLDTNPLGDWEA